MSYSFSFSSRQYQQEEKVPIWLVGDTERRFCEYPILRRPGYDWGLSYNNSRLLSCLWNHKQQHLYQWMKRYENQWSWITLVVDSINNKIHFYLNDKESDVKTHDHGTHSPQSFEGVPKRYGTQPYYIGTTTSVGIQDVNKFFKGDITKVMMWDRKLEESEIKNIYKRPVRDGLKLFYDFNLENANDLSGNENHGKIFNCEQKNEK